MLRLAAIHVYPVKSCRGLAPATAEVEPWGLAGDRRWMLVNGDGRFQTQREIPRLTQVSARYDPDGALVLRAVGFPELVVAAPADGLTAVRIWRDEVLVAPAAEEANAWLHAVLGRDDVRLVHLDDPTRRPVDEHYGAAEDRVNLADGFPVLVTTLASLDALNGWLVEAGEPGAPLPMNRFRPSVVVAGGTPWQEDGWRRVRIGGVTFRIVKPCGRCVITTTDQETGERGHEPLFTLGQRRRIGKRLVFGQNTIPENTGTVSVGDEVTVLEHAEPTRPE